MTSKMQYVDSGAARPADIQVSITRDVMYGEAGIGFHSGEPRQRRLLMDIYAPVGDNTSQPRAAIVFAFGGAFHRGTKEDDRVEDNFAENTSVAEYCLAFAKRGYVCCSIDYRLTPEDPDPGVTPIVCAPENIDRSRIDLVRGLMGLPPSTAKMIGDAIEAAIDDMQSAFEYVRANAAQWQIDPERIAVAGYSAGAIMAIATGYATPTPAAAVISVSGAMGLAEMDKYLGQRSDVPPGLFIHGSDDLGGIGPGSALLAARLRSNGVVARRYIVEGGTHFYPSDSPVSADPANTTGAIERATAPLSVDGAIADFLRMIWPA